jgi:hypothetical protein
MEEGLGIRSARRRFPRPPWPRRSPLPSIFPPGQARYTGFGQLINDWPVTVTNTGDDYIFDLYFGDTGIQLLATGIAPTR